MQQGRHLKALATTLAAIAIVAAAVLANSSQALAGQDDSSEPGNSESIIQEGFRIAPVPLNLAGKNRALVGLGSYLVNAIGDCNGCHSAGPQTEYLPGRNPFFGQPQSVNPATYLGGGRDFGPLIPGSAHIISRNLTPGKSGLPEGDHTFEEFRQILRTGVDMDHLHPNCTGAPNAGCIPRPFDGSLLQIMPWPAFQKMTDRDIRAIYEYLRAIPCVQGNYPEEPADRCQ